MPLIVAIAVLSGAFRLWGEEQGYYGEQAGIALQVMSSVVVTSVVLVTTALALYRSDQARKEREGELKRSDQFNRLIASANPDCVSLIGDDNVVLFANEALIESHGMNGESELVGQPCGHHLDALRRTVIDAALQKARTIGTARFTLSFPQANGEVFWFDTLISRLPVDHETPYCLLSVSRDITEKKKIEDQVQWQALHDHLTGLPNRAHFQAQLEERIAAQGEDCFAVLMVDIDDFKLVNDTLGHDAGDTLLSTIAQRIASALRDKDFVARLAGDEFAVILNEVRSETGVTAVAQRIFDNLREPWMHDGRLADCRVSIGASIARTHSVDATELLKNADIALYAAKARGKGQLAVFQSGMKATVEKRSKQLALARQALRSDLIVPYYQPKIDLAKGNVSGFEALLRWRHARGGIQLPSTIQAAFEDMELGGEITECMLSRVLWDVSHWLDQGLDFGHVAINLTAADLRQADFATRLLTRLDTQSIPHNCLQVEVTETVFLGRSAGYVERTLQTLHDTGIKVALDDFGTGYASLSHLKQFPVDIVKIDRSFLQDLGQNPQSQAIIATVVGLGHSLNIEVVAEGIETEEQLRYLVTGGCTFGQGHLFGKAMPASRVPGLVRFPHREVRRAA